MGRSAQRAGAAGSAFERALLAKPLTARRAGRLIASVSLTFTLVGGILAWLLGGRAVGNLGDSLWWALQTVTTVGYGDVVPENAVGRIVGTVLMVNGIALISVTTAVVSATMTEQLRRHRHSDEREEMVATIGRIEARLERIESSLVGSDQSAAD